MLRKRKDIRNIAIVAHIDHGKTTLLDALLKQGHVFHENELIPERVMDSNDQEKERGITIFAKHTAVVYEGVKINVIDTPGHADFSGEVERILGMVNSVLLLVDAKEGPMPQTRFVLSKALKMGLRPLVIFNKIDRPQADPDAALNETFDLFCELGATPEQLDFAYCYASGIAGYALKNLGDEPKDLSPLFQMILDEVPAPEGDEEGPFLMQVATIHYSDYVGRQACGRILQGSVSVGDDLMLNRLDEEPYRVRISNLETFMGLSREECAKVGVGDIVILSGTPEVTIGDTLSSLKNPQVLSAIPLDEPTVSVELSVNSSPFVGRVGKFVTMNKIRERLQRERLANVSLKIEYPPGNQEIVKVSGRGELHLAVLLEAMRREGFELSASKPQVILKEIAGQKHEPLERVHIEVPQEYSGAVIEELSRRKGEMQALHTNEHGVTSLEFLIPTRGLMGYRQEFLTVTRGLGILTSIFEEFTPMKGEIVHRHRGVLISMCSGRTNAFACFSLQDRGELFVAPGDEVYEGMVVGQHSRSNDLIVNVTKAKQLTNFRSSGAEEALVMPPPRRFMVEQAIDYIDKDELIEITPKGVRLRKIHLKETDRKRNSR